MHYLTLYLVALPIALLIDLLWIGVIANRFYREQLGSLFAPQVSWIPALIFYLIFVAALVYFVIAPAVEIGSLMRAVVLGAFLGLMAYATYDLTNLAVIKDWPVYMSIVDMVWGTVMTASVSGATYVIATRVLGL